MIWSSRETERLRKLYVTHSAEDIAIRMGLTVSCIRNKVHSLGLKKSKAWIRANSRKNAKHNEVFKAFCFSKGHKTWNAGKKGWQAGGRAKETQFKKGQPIWNAKPVGTERVNKDGHIEVKVSEPDNWKRKQHIVYEQAHGEIPKGALLRFKDGNMRNFSLVNLELIDRAENMERNTIHRYPRELKFAMRLSKRLKREIHEKRN